MGKRREIKPFHRRGKVDQVRELLKRPFRGEERKNLWVRHSRKHRTHLISCFSEGLDGPEIHERVVEIPLSWVDRFVSLPS